MSKETRTRVAALKKYTKDLITYQEHTLLRQRGLDRNATPTTGNTVTRRDMTGILLQVTEQRLDQAARRRPQNGAAPSQSQELVRQDQTPSRRVLSTVKDKLSDRNLIRNIKVGVLSKTLAHALTLLPSTTNAVLRSHLSRINHEEVYGPSKEVGGVKKFALELILGDIPSAAGAVLTGRRLGVGRPLDRVGRVIELVGAVPALTAPHRTREGTENEVFNIVRRRALDAADRAAHPGETAKQRRARRAAQTTNK